MSTTGRTSSTMKGTFVVLIVQHVLLCVYGIRSEQYIKTFKEVCPYNNLCNDNATQVNTNPNLTPCCEECSCEADCNSFQNCCPDTITFDVTEQPSLVPCVSVFNVYLTNLTIDDRTRFFGYRVISSCPLGQRSDMCQKSLRSLDNVVSDSKGRVYRNEDCALCHGVTAFTKWEIRIMACEGLFYQTFDTPEDRHNYIFNHCLAVAVPPEEKVNPCVLRPNRTCSKTIESDSLRMDPCKETTNNNIVMYGPSPKRKFAYANADCFLCNNHFYGNSDVNYLEAKLCDVTFFARENLGFKNPKYSIYTLLITKDRSMHTCRLMVSIVT